MKKILYLLCSCFAVTLMASCEDFLDKTPQGDKTDQDIFSRFNETESLINRLYFYARAADQPLVHIRFFSDSALTDECEGSSAENGWFNKFNDGDWEPGSQLYTSCNAPTNPGACHTFWPKLYEDIRCARNHASSRFFRLLAFLFQFCAKPKPLSIASAEVSFEL